MDIIRESATVPTNKGNALERFRQGSTRRTLPMHREAGNAYVMYRIAPNGRPARLERAK